MTDSQRLQGRTRSSRTRPPESAALSPEEIADVVAFLASDEAAYVNGHVLVADGGLSASP